MSILLSLFLVFSSADGKIAITAAGSNPESNVDLRFGHPAFYMIYDPADGSWQAMEGSDMASGAGREAAAALKEKGVKVVITGQCGHNALGALRSAGIEIYHAADCTVAKALRDFQAGRLKPIK